jgi:hypothetical protein
MYSPFVLMMKWIGPAFPTGLVVRTQRSPRVERP